MPSTAALLRAPGLRGIKHVSTLSCWRKFKMKSPTGSAPTAVNRAVFRFSRCEPTAMLVGDPPTYAAKLLISTNAAPTSLEYKSMDERPMVSRSKVLVICQMFLYKETLKACPEPVEGFPLQTK